MGGNLMGMSNIVRFLRNDGSYGYRQNGRFISKQDGERAYSKPTQKMKSVRFQNIRSNKATNNNELVKCDDNEERIQGVYTRVRIVDRYIPHP